MTRHSDIPEIENKMSEALRSLADKRGRPVLCISGHMDQSSVEKVRDIADGLAEFRELSVLLHSPGGDIEDAYRMILALREYATDVEVLVPRWAKSAATFFCLAADTIYIGRHGELGPLDPQRLNLRGSTKPISALESFRALDQLLQYSMDSLDMIVVQLLSNAPIDIPYAIEHAQPLFAAIVSPLYSQVDPHELGDAGRALDISEEYAVRVMERWSYAEEQRESVRRIARNLTRDYPTHGFVIDLTEARNIGLKADRLDRESDDMCQAIVAGIDTYIGIEVPSKQDGPPILECDPATSHKTNEKEEYALPQQEDSTEAL